MACLIVLSALFIGCGTDRMPRGTVTGKVSVAGQPATDAVIQFENAATGIALWAALGPNGEYSIGTHEAAGLPEGTYRVAIKPRPGSGTDPDATSAPPGVVAPPSTIPARYHSYETSGLTITVKASDNPPFNFPLPGE